ncbi:MAG: hypothetical protein VW378_01280 [bacterium]
MNNKMYLILLCTFLFSSISVMGDYGLYLGYISFNKDKKLDNTYETGVSMHNHLSRNLFYSGKIGFLQTFLTSNTDFYTKRVKRYVLFSFFLQIQPYPVVSYENLWIGLGVVNDTTHFASPALNFQYYFEVSDLYFANIGLQISRDVSVYSSLFRF